MSENKNKKQKINIVTKLDIGCGANKQLGFTGIDIVSIEGVDIVHDLEKYPWPIKANSIEEVFSSHVIEHIKDLFKFFDELYRIMKVGAKATFIAPYYSSIRSMQDPSHIRPISEATFLYANKGWRVANKLDHYPVKADFDFAYGYSMDPTWANKAVEARDFAIKHYINVVQDITVTMTRRE